MAFVVLGLILERGEVCLFIGVLIIPKVMNLGKPHETFVLYKISWQWKGWKVKSGDRMVWTPSGRKEGLVVVVDSVDYAIPKPLVNVRWRGFIFWVLFEDLREVGVFFDEKK